MSYWNYKEEIKPYLRQGVMPSLSLSALLVIDMQNYFVQSKFGREIVDNVKEVIELCRKKGVFIVYTKHEHIDPSVDGGMLNRWWGELIIKGTKEAEIYPGLAPQQEEPVISKRRYSAFFGTELDSLLRLRGIEDLIISGVMTNLCCESTARDGFMHDFRIFFLQDATSTINKDLHLATLKNLAYGFAYVITLSELKRAWRI